MSDLQGSLHNRLRELKTAIIDKESELDRVQHEVADLRDQEQACATLLRKQFGEHIVVRDLFGVSIRQAAAAVLREGSISAEGLHVEELTKRMLQRGWQTDAANPVGSVTSCLHRYAEFKRPAPNIYRLVDVRSTADPAQNEE